MKSKSDNIESKDKTVAEKIWDQIKNMQLEIFGLPNQFIHLHCKPLFLDNNKIDYIKTSAGFISIYVGNGENENFKNIDCEKIAKSWNFSWPNLWLSSAGNKETLIAIKFITEEEISSNESISDAKIDCDSVASHA